MEGYTGKISLGEILNKKVPSDKFLTEKHVELVHYPDSQQLIIWLPDHYRFYNELKITNTTTAEVALMLPVRELVNGSIQIIIDSLPLPPAHYIITIDTLTGGSHNIEFEKLSPEVILPESSEPNQINHHQPHIYRNGNGQILPDEDLILRDKIKKQLSDQFFPGISYENYGRSGYVIYTQGDQTVKFEMEYGGGNCVFYLIIPTVSNWEKETGFQLSQRHDILEKVAMQTQRDQASTCRYEISDQYITYYR